jgi:hypothetical protein
MGLKPYVDGKLGGDYFEQVKHAIVLCSNYSNSTDIVDLTFVFQGRILCDLRTKWRSSAVPAHPHPVGVMARLFRSCSLVKVPKFLHSISKKKI